MNLIEYTPENSKGVKSTAPFIRLDSSRKGISFSARAMLRYDLKIGDKVKFTQDRETPCDWYICKDEKGFELKTYSKGENLWLCCSRLVADIKDSLGLGNENVNLILGETIQFDGKEYITIITAGAK